MHNKLLALTAILVERMEPKLGPSMAAKRAGFELLGLDYMVDTDMNGWLLEVNTMPGMTSHSLLPKAAAAAGIDMTPLCVGLVDRALARSTGSWAASVHPTGSPSRK